MHADNEQGGVNSEKTSQVLVLGADAGARHESRLCEKAAPPPKPAPPSKAAPEVDPSLAIADSRFLRGHLRLCVRSGIGELPRIARSEVK